MYVLPASILLTLSGIASIPILHFVVLIFYLSSPFCVQSMWHVREAVPVCLMEMCRGNLELSSSESNSSNPSSKKLYKYDVSISLQQTEDFLSELKRKLSTYEGIRVLTTTSTSTATTTTATSTLVSETSSGVGLTDLLFCCFGHAGDENLHLNIIAIFHFTPEYQVEELDRRSRQLQELLNTHVFDLVLQRRGSISAEHGIGQQKVDAMRSCRSGPELNVMRAIKQALDPMNTMNPGKVVPDG